MESHKNKVLRITKNIFNIKPGVIVEITQANNEKYMGICKCINNNYDIYDFDDYNISWGLSCETLDDMRDTLLIDYISEHLITDIRL